MIVQRINFDPILPDNETTYLNYLEGLIESVDSQSDMVITKTIAGILVRISPSGPMHFGEIFSVIKRFHTMLGLRVEFSKSMKAASNISFLINF